MSLLDLISKDARWKGKDDFPSNPEWKLEIEKWLEFLEQKNQFKRFRNRLIRSDPRKRDETLAEISAAFYIDSHFNCPIVDWEPMGSGGLTLEFTFKGNKDILVFCEVKSPGWEKEVIEEEGINRSKKRIQEEKIKDGEVRSIGSWKDIRRTIKKAYPKFFNDQPSLLIINDDLFVSPTYPPINIEIALFCEIEHGEHDPESYLSEDGYFLTDEYKNLGGILFLKVFHPSKGIEYKSKLIRNPKASPSCKIPSLPNGL